MKDSEDQLTINQSPTHKIPSDPTNSTITPVVNDKIVTDMQVQARTLSLGDIKSKLNGMFVDLPMLRQGVRKTGGLQQFRESLVCPQAMQILDGFLTRLTGQKYDSTVDGRYRAKNRPGRTWDYWIMQYRD